MIDHTQTPVPSLPPSLAGSTSTWTSDDALETHIIKRLVVRSSPDFLPLSLSLSLVPHLQLIAWHASNETIFVLLLMAVGGVLVESFTCGSALECLEAGLAFECLCGSVLWEEKVC